MSHSDLHVPEDVLALHATGDPLPQAMARHLDTCDRCRVELDQLVGVLQLARSTTRADAPETPPASVWQGIARELDLPAQSTSDDKADVVPLGRPRRTWTTTWLVAATVAGVIGGGALAAVVTSSLQDAPAPVAAPSPQPVANAALAPLPDHQGSGEAEIVRAADGGRELIVDVSDLSGTGQAGSPKGFFEVWLIDPETFEMVGLGALTSRNGRFPIPDGLDLSRYTVVDVSLEPFDGDPVHSRDSVVRGELQT